MSEKPTRMTDEQRREWEIVVACAPQYLSGKSAEVILAADAELTALRAQVTAAEQRAQEAERDARMREAERDEIRLMYEHFHAKAELWARTDEAHRAQVGALAGIANTFAAELEGYEVSTPAQKARDDFAALSPDTAEIVAEQRRLERIEKAASRIWPPEKLAAYRQYFAEQRAQYGEWITIENLPGDLLRELLDALAEPKGEGDGD